MTLPIPPRTAAVNALMPGTKPMNESTSEKFRANSTPATPASIPPMAKVVTTTRLMLIPIRLAISLSSETARIALPVLVLAMNNRRPTIITIAVRMVSTWVRDTGKPRMLNVPLRLLTLG